MIAIPVMRARVAPVLNWCSRIVIFPDDAGAGVGQELQLPDLTALERLQVLRQKGVDTLICGALSLELLQSAEYHGFKVISGVAGQIDEVLKAYREGHLAEPEFWLPGCRGPRRYRRGYRPPEGLPARGETGGKLTMPGGRSGRGQGQGGGSGRGQGQGRGSGQGRGQCRAAGGAGGALGGQGLCRCPACGATAPHERGIPCIQVKCPQCGKTMVRE